MNTRYKARRRIRERNAYHTKALISCCPDPDNIKYAWVTCDMRGEMPCSKHYSRELYSTYNTYCEAIDLPQTKRRFDDDEPDVYRMRIFREDERMFGIMVSGEDDYVQRRFRNPGQECYRYAMKRKFGGKKDMRCVLAPDSESFAATSDKTRLRMLYDLVDSGYPLALLLREYRKAHPDDPDVNPESFREGIMYNIRLIQKRREVVPDYSESMMMEVGEWELADMLQETVKASLGI